jgi:imidazolonepropionase-like amidohydrolase
MSFCEHCAGQRFDRAQVLRALREARRNLPRRGRASQADAALAAAIHAVRSLEIPHIEYFDETTGDEVLH